jgi:multiple sugar transport system ATP-binding protein
VSASGVALDVPRSAAAAPAAVLGVRPEHVLLDPDGPVAASVEQVEYFGSHWIAGLASAIGPLKAVLPREQQPRAGDRLALKLRTERVVLFDAASSELLPSAATLEDANV